MRNLKVAANNKPFALFLEIESTKPAELMITGYDEADPGTVYFERQYGSALLGELFKGRDTLEFPLPVYPKRLKIDVVNAYTGNADGVYIHNLSAKPFTPEVTQLLPDVAEFVEFAKWFAVHVNRLEPGLYESKNGAWNIYLAPSRSFVEQLPDGNFEELYTEYAMVDHYTGLVYIIKPDFLKLPVPTRFMVLAHEFTHFYFAEFNELEADDLAIDLSLGLGFSRTEMTYSIPRLFGDCVGNCANRDEKERRAIAAFNKISKQEESIEY